jgi:uncharacterized membrane protein
VIHASAVWLSVIAVALLAVSGWLGGKMVYEHGIAVDIGEEPARLHLGRGDRLRT